MQKSQKHKKTQKNTKKSGWGTKGEWYITEKMRFLVILGKNGPDMGKNGLNWQNGGEVENESIWSV